MMEDNERRNIAVLISAFGYPGSGQFLQKRPLAGFIYAALFTLTMLAWMLYLAIPIGYWVYTAPREGATLSRLAHSIPWRTVLFWFAMHAGVYAINLVDVFYMNKRKLRE